MSGAKREFRSGGGNRGSTEGPSQIVESGKFRVLTGLSKRRGIVSIE